jgi:hypothetical protein
LCREAIELRRAVSVFLFEYYGIGRFKLKLALGTVQFGLDYGIANNTGQVGREEARSILEIAQRAGINTLDTAIAYGNSESELGAIGVQEWRVITKLPSLPDNRLNAYSWVINQIYGSLQRLRMTSVDGLLLHRPAQLFEPGGAELLAALKDLKSQGIVSKVGVSVYTPDELKGLFDFHRFDIVQAPLNILDRRLIESGWASKLKKEGVEIHSRSSFLQGLLLLNDQSRPKYFDRWATIWKTWSSWLKETNLSPLQACVLYSLSIDSVDKVIVGVDGAKQLEEILIATKAYLPSLPQWPVALDSDLLNPAKWNQP